MFKASKATKGFFEIHGIEEFIEKKFNEFKHALGIGAAPMKAEMKPVAKKAAAVSVPMAKVAPVKKSAKTKAAAKVAKAAAPMAKKSEDVLGTLAQALDSHPKKAAVVKAGKKKDQLLRALIPLYLARGAKSSDVSSGVTSKFWAQHGIKFAAPNAAKALREHKGFSTRSKSGVVISSNGVKYVEEALKK